MKYLSCLGVWFVAAGLVSCDGPKREAEVSPTPPPAATPAASMSANAPSPAARPAEEMTITVPPGKRQTFAGFGTSLGNWRGEYQALSPEERARLVQLFWHDLGFNTVRLWFNTYEYAPQPGGHDLTTFKRCYVDSGIIADARKNGVTILLLGPDGLPDYMKEKRADGDVHLKDAKTRDYAILIADFISQLKRETGVELDATGVQNEPNGLDRFTPGQIAEVVKFLRAELDRRGLASVKVIAPEQSSVDGVYYTQLDVLKNDPAAWQALAGVASHSYNMAATADAARRIEGPDGGNLKEYWMTEACDNGSEQPGDARRAVSLGARFLNDVNHRVTHWVHFLGFEGSDPKDNATRIIAYSTNPLQMVVYQKYYVYQQLARTFDYGATFRRSESSLDQDMTWTYGRKPRITAAAAANPDGSWGVGIANYTADSFDGVQGWADAKWNAEQGGHTPGTAYRVSVKIEELQDKGAIPFVVHRTSATAQNAGGKETVTMKDGVVSVTVAPMEFVTLRSGR